MHQKPAFIINLTVPCGYYDINLTPDKREVLFVHQDRIIEGIKLELDRLYAPSRYSFQLSQGIINNQSQLLTNFLPVQEVISISKSEDNNDIDINNNDINESYNDNNKIYLDNDLKIDNSSIVSNININTTNSTSNNKMDINVSEDDDSNVSHKKPRWSSPSKEIETIKVSRSKLDVFKSLPQSHTQFNNEIDNKFETDICNVPQNEVINILDNENSDNSINNKVIGVWEFDHDDAIRISLKRKNKWSNRYNHRRELDKNKSSNIADDNEVCGDIEEIPIIKNESEVSNSLIDVKAVESRVLNRQVDLIWINCKFNYFNICKL
jgi:DNA mismatch repair ATPase MutL